MSPAVRRSLLQTFQRLYGPDAPATRAKFGRYVASVGGQCSPVSSGYEAWVANYRERGHGGFRNQTWRKHMERSVTPQPSL